MFGAETVQAEAGGDIRPSRFVKLDASNNNTLLESNANERSVGISQPGTKEAPGTTGASVNAAEANDSFEYFPWGRVTRIEVGSGGLTAADEVESDADGKGVTVSGSGDHEVSAIAVEDAAANEFGQVLVISYFRQIA